MSSYNKFNFILLQKKTRLFSYLLQKLEKTHSCDHVHEVCVEIFQKSAKLPVLQTFTWKALTAITCATTGKFSDTESFISPAESLEWTDFYPFP